MYKRQFLTLARPPRPVSGRREIACYVISSIFCVGIVYGLLYAVCASTVTRQLFAAVFFNVMIVALWNRMSAFAEVRASRQSAVQDTSLLVGAYTCFLVGWVAGYCVILPDLKQFLMESIMAHAVNVVVCLHVILFRVFCVVRGGEELSLIHI